ncbi:MAG: hypothetical protein B7C24_04725 [Bacteroidetes bacterium 4572_77]|nr:MAG: hypothetical protein B7C24_04725 [Bacteroidetes bacterium 4572_77]
MELSFTPVLLFSFFSFISIILVLGIIFILLFLYLFNRYKKKVGVQKVISLEKQLQKYIKENKIFRSELQDMVKKKSGSLVNENEQQQQHIICRNMELKRVRDAYYSRNKYLSNMNYEIRTPLNTIIGFSNILKTELEESDQKEWFEYAQKIANSGGQILELLEDLIDISRVNANEFVVNPQLGNINKSIKKSIDLLSSLAQEKNLKLVFNPQSIQDITYDDYIVERIVSLVLKRAIKQTAQGSVQISAQYLLSDSQIIIKIKDTGIGLDPKYIPQLFEAFRTDNLGFGKNDGEPGLGLPLAKKLSELLGGSLSASSQKGIGTEITLYLPCYLQGNNDDVGLKGDKSQGLDLKKIPNVLVVEDDKMHRKVFEKMLENNTHLHICSDGEEALEEVEDRLRKKQLFDLVLMDINLPAPWDGVSLMKEIKEKHPSYQRVPFVAQTAYAMTQDEELMLREGFDDYIPKPIEKAKLYFLIESILK